MSELQDKLKSIYEETSSKLIPENINYKNIKGGKIKW